MTKVLKGFNPDGPKVALIAGIHGNELTPTDTLYILLQPDNKALLRSILIGTSSLSIYNYVNKDAIKQCKRGITNDLNRVLGKDDIKVKLESIVSDNDIIIDIHSSLNITELVLIDQGPTATVIGTWCRQAKVPYLCRAFSGNTIKKYALSKNKIGLTLELVGLDVTNYSSAIQGLYILERLLTTAIPTKNLKVPKTNTVIKAPKTGIFKSYADSYLGMRVSKGDSLGHITSINTGNTLATVRTNYSGKVLATPDNSYVKKNDVLFLVQN